MKELAQYQNLDERKFNNELSKACTKKDIRVVGYLLTTQNYKQYADKNIIDNKLLLVAINNFIYDMNRKEEESLIDMEMISYLIINFNFSKTKKVEKKLAYILITEIKKDIDNLFILGERKRNLEKTLTNKSNVKIINKIKL